MLKKQLFQFAKEEAQTEEDLGNKSVPLV